MDIMASNVFTKKEILQNLASRGYFIDIYTLDAFFAKKKIEAIFEDSQGNEFFDQNALNVVLEGLFASNSNQILNSAPGDTQPAQPAQINTPQPPSNTQEAKIEDKDTFDVLNNISLSDGTPLINKLDNLQNLDIGPQAGNPAQPNPVSQLNSEPPAPLQEDSIKPASSDNQFDFNPVQNDFISTNQDPTQVPMGETVQDEEIPIPRDEFDEQKQGDEFGKDDFFDVKADGLMPSEMSNDLSDVSNFDDISLLSESLEAQEKLRQYVMSELSKTPSDVVPQSPQNPNEFKLDISERTLTMIARTMAKKIAKYVGSILAQDAKQASKVEEYKEENKRLTQKARELEEQNRKLRLLLAESNKNLNSYKPSIFGLYKKVDPKQNKK